MCSVFGKPSHGSHPYDPTLRNWLSSDDEQLQAMARNIMHDLRVSDERADILKAKVNARIKREGKESLRRGLDDYYYERVRQQKNPDFVNRDINEENILSDKLNPDVQFARILNLNKLFKVFQKGVFSRFNWRETLAEFDFPWRDYEEENEYPEWLKSVFSDPSKTISDRLVTALLDILNFQHKSTPFEPSWTTRWESLKPYLDSKKGVPPNADRWVEALGVGPKEDSHWFIVLVYRRREIGAVVRPTQLDAGYYAWHFPSPPNTSVSGGGHPNDLRTSPPADSLRPEYIHKQINHSLQHWIDSGRSVGVTNNTNVSPLFDIRQFHHILLKKKYGTDTIRQWMPRPMR